MSGDGAERLRAAVQEGTRQLLAQFRPVLQQWAPFIRGGGIDFGVPGAVISPAQPAQGGTGNTTGAPAGDTYGIAYTSAGDVALRADGTIATKRFA